MTEKYPQMSFEDIDQELCPHCGAKMRAYWHRLTPMLVKGLIKFRKAVVEKGVNKIHLQRDLNLTKTEYNNFQKLRLHGLVAKFREDNERVNGYWLLTRRGGLFLNNHYAIPKRVKTFRNKVIEHDKELVTVVKVIGSEPYLETITDIQYEII